MSKVTVMWLRVDDRDNFEIVLRWSVQSARW